MTRYVHPETELAFNEAYGKLRRERDELQARVAELETEIERMGEELSAKDMIAPRKDGMYKWLRVCPVSARVRAERVSEGAIDALLEDLTDVEPGQQLALHWPYVRKALREIKHLRNELDHTMAERDILSEYWERHYKVVPKLRAEVERLRAEVPRKRKDGE